MQTKKNTERAIIYARINAVQPGYPCPSTEEQVIACREYAKKHGWEVADVYREVASGNDSRRAELMRMLMYKRQDGVTRLIVSTFDRLSRDVSQMMSILKNLKRLGIEVVAIHERPEDFGIGEYAAAIQQLFADYDRNCRCQRAKASARKRKMALKK